MFGSISRALSHMDAKLKVWADVLTLWVWQPYDFILYLGEIT